MDLNKLKKLDISTVDTCIYLFCVVVDQKNSTSTTTCILLLCFFSSHQFLRYLRLRKQYKEFGIKKANTFIKTVSIAND